MLRLLANNYHKNLISYFLILEHTQPFLENDYILPKETLE